MDVGGKMKDYKHCKDFPHYFLRQNDMDEDKGGCESCHCFVYMCISNAGIVSADLRVLRSLKGMIFLANCTQYVLVINVLCLFTQRLILYNWRCFNET